MKTHRCADPTLLITGASGFTGCHIAKLARSRGFCVVALQSDLRDAGALAAEVSSLRPDYVLHLAGISNTLCTDARLLHSVNVVGTRNLLLVLTMTRPKPRNIVLASSVLVYGSKPTSPVCESTPVAPCNPYAHSKVAMEQVAAAFASLLPICVARPFNYTGQGQPTAFLIPKIVDHFRRREPHMRLGNVGISREFNDVRFVCEVYLRLLQTHAPPPIINVCRGMPHSLEHVLNVLTRLTKHRVAVVVDQDLVRANDVSVLYGDASVLRETVGSDVFKHASLEALLAWMLQESSKSEAQ